MADIVKSVFRRRVLEKVYDFIKYAHADYFGGVSEEFRISVTHKLVEDKEIGHYDIEIPLLDIGDKFFLDDIKEQVTVTDRMRSSDGSIIYFVEDKVIETENTKRSYEECQKMADGMYKKLQYQFDDYRRKYKYERRFLNFRKAK